MRIAIWIIAVFGAIVLLGGIIGYVQAKSLASLFSGTILGVALLSSAIALLKNVNTAHYVAMLIAALLTIFFHYRYLETGAVVPALMAVTSCLVTVALLILRPKRRH